MQTITQKPYKVGQNFISYKPEELPAMYMFLPVSVYAIEHLTTETLWGSLPSSFNDPFDSLGTINENVLKECLLKQYETYPFVFDPQKTIEQSIKEMISRTRAHFEKLRDNYFVSCFTPKIQSEIMWAHYARNATGFALQYSAIDIIASAQEYFQRYKESRLKNDAMFSPVLYYDEPVDITETAIDLAEGLLQFVLDVNKGKKSRYFLKDELLPFSSMLLHKNECWKYEEEYRLCVQNFPLFLNGENKRYIEIGHCKPTAIYLGANIENSYEQILMRIAKEKSIPVYKMKAKIIEGKYCLVGEKIPSKKP